MHCRRNLATLEHRRTSLSELLLGYKATACFAFSSFLLSLSHQTLSPSLSHTHHIQLNHHGELTLSQVTPSHSIADTIHVHAQSDSKTFSNDHEFASEQGKKGGATQPEEVYKVTSNPSSSSFSTEYREN